MRFRRMYLQRGLSICSVAVAALGVTATQAASLVPITSFGGGDGWRAPFEVIAGDVEGTTAPHPVTGDPTYRFLGNGLPGSPAVLPPDPASAINAGNLERGLAYNPVSGNLLLVSRNAPNGGNIRILSGTTGADLGSLNQNGISGGNFSMNMIGVADDGAIYLSNLTSNLTSSAYKIYRWENEDAVPSVVFDSSISGGLLDGARLGDSFDVSGSGVNTRFVAGYGPSGSIAGTNGFAQFSTTDGVSFTGSSIAVSSAAPLPTLASGEFQYGITFGEENVVIGKSRSNPASVVEVSGTMGTLVEQHGTDGISMRLLDFAMVGGKPLLATLEANGANAQSRPRVMIYDMSDPTLPLIDRKIAEASAMTEPLGPNGNAAGQIKFGPIEGNVATLYAMSTNNGIQAFTLTLDPVVEPVDDADFNGDGIVDGADFLIWQRGSGLSAQTDKSTGDADGDGNVNDADLLVWKDQFGTSTLPPAVSAVPEPAAFALAALALGGIALRRRQR